MSLRSAIEARALTALMALPPRLQRLVGGAPIVIDGQALAPDLQVMLRAQRIAHKSEMVGQTLAQGRDALRTNAVLVGGRPPIGAVRDLTVAGLRARHYLPHGTRDAGRPGPLLLFFHGGGFLYGDIDSHDAPCRLLAERAGIPVLSVEYGLGPEHAFPRAFDDATDAVRWVHEHAQELDVDVQRIAVGGDSAGGNIAAWVAISAAREGIPLAFQLLLYPCTIADRDTESLRLFGDGFYLTADSIRVFLETYLPTPAERDDERVQLVTADLPTGLAPALVVTAGFDPLRDEGEAYARRLAETGVAVETRRFVDQIHGFANIVGVGRTSRAAVLEIADRLRTALA